MIPQRVIAATLLAIIGLSVVLETVHACSCMPRHPQEHYCSADYVIVARILSRRPVQHGKSVYKIDIRKTYKMTEKAQHYLKQGRIFSANNDGMCGYNFKLGELYLIAASSSSVGLCNYIRPYSEMSIVEKRGVAGGYKKGCECSVNYCYDFDTCPRPAGGCGWLGPWNTCETDFGICIPSRGSRDEQGRPAKCHWRRSNPYLNCIHDP